MQSFPQTIVLRHQKENLKKCSLKGLEHRSDFSFYKYPIEPVKIPPLDGYIILSVDAEPLTIADCNSGLFVLDGTWRLVGRMGYLIKSIPGLIPRSIPNWITAYPRRQEDCPIPGQGLASIEAIYAAYYLLGRNTDGLLDNYHWKEEFLLKNAKL